MPLTGDGPWVPKSRKAGHAPTLTHFSSPLAGVPSPEAAQRAKARVKGQIKSPSLLAGLAARSHREGGAMLWPFLELLTVEEAATCLALGTPGRLSLVCPPIFGALT